MATDQNLVKASSSGVRGVSYPAISLEDAVSRAKELWERERKNPAPMEAVASHWGYSPSSSGVRTTVAALISFGLVSDTGSGEHRQIQLTPRGLDIVLGTPDRDVALLEAVTSPKIYAELLGQWSADNLPSDQTLKVHLLRHKNFNPKSVDSFIKDFKDSIGFSGLAKAGIMPHASASKTSEVPEMQPNLGEHSHGNRSERGVRHGTQALAAGEHQWFSSDLSTETKCRVLISGEIGPDEIDVLIELLEVQKRIREKKRSAEAKVIGQAPEEPSKA
jgi:hypothetical protein